MHTGKGFDAIVVDFVADSGTLEFLAFLGAKCEPVHTRVNSDPWRPVEEG